MSVKVVTLKPGEQVLLVSAGSKATKKSKPKKKTPSDAATKPKKVAKKREPKKANDPAVVIKKVPKKK